MYVLGITRHIVAYFWLANMAFEISDIYMKWDIKTLQKRKKNQRKFVVFFLALFHGKVQ